MRLAKKHHAPIITSTYNEPLITSEWAVAVFKEAKAAGLVCSYVSNGNGTPEVLDYIRPWVSLYKVDLKSFRDRHYRELGGTLERVLWTIRALHEQGFWLEIVTLVVPGFNDSDEELREIAEFLASVSPGHPLARDRLPSRLQDDGSAAHIRASAPPRGGDRGSRGAALRLHGQPPGQTKNRENTYCPGCQALAHRADRLHRAPESDRKRRLPRMRPRDSRLLGMNLARLNELDGGSA